MTTLFLGGRSMEWQYSGLASDGVSAVMAWLCALWGVRLIYG